jgi:osmotically-inducible protein OsmY
MKFRSTIRFVSASTLASLAVSAWSAGIAQNAAVAQERSLTAMVVPAIQEHPTATDQQLQDKVENALRSDPYFYAAHVNVSVKNGSVVLQGFVFSDWDLRDAIRIATKAAGGGRVIDSLTIEVGGRR